LAQLISGDGDPGPTEEIGISDGIPSKMNMEYKVKEWHTGSVHEGETGALGLQAMLNEPDLSGYRLHTVLGGIDQSLLIFTKETGET
jgi:hypothetical protein